MRCRVPLDDRRGGGVGFGQPAELGFDDAFDEVVADSLVPVDAERAGCDQCVAESSPFVIVRRLGVHRQVGERDGPNCVDSGQRRSCTLSALTKTI